MRSRGQLPGRRPVLVAELRRRTQMLVEADREFLSLS